MGGLLRLFRIKVRMFCPTGGPIVGGSCSPRKDYSRSGRRRSTAKRVRNKALTRHMEQYDAHELPRVCERPAFGLPGPTHHQS